MLNAADDPKAEEARRLAEKKRNAYFAELEKESTAKGKRSKKAVASKDLAVKPAKPLAGSKMAFPVGLKKTSNIAMKGVAAPAAAEKKGTGTATTAGDLTTITGIPPPPEEDPPLTDDTDEADANKYVRFTVPSGCGGEDGATHVRVQVPGGPAGAGPVVEVELPIGAKEGDALEAEVTAWDASDVPPPAPPRAMGAAGVGAGAAPKLKPPGAGAGAATAPKLGAGAVGAVNASPAAGRSFFTVLVIRGCEIFDSTARTTALSSAGSVSVGATSARPVASGDLGFKPAGLGTTAGESNAPLEANLLMGENAASDAGGGECESTISCFAVGVEGFGAFLARFSFVSPARILPRTSSSLAVCESIISRRRRSSRIASSRSAGVTASAGRPPLPLDSGRGTAAAASDLAAVDADFSVPLAEPRMPPKPAPRLTRPLDADAEP